MTGKPPWLKVLYLKLPYPDNYYDESFLSELQTNANVKVYPYTALVETTFPITAHLACTLTHVAVFVHLYLGNILPKQLLSVTPLGTLLIWSITGRANPSVYLLLLPILLYLLSPPLRTLTEATTSDSIWALASVLLLINLVLGSDISDALLELDQQRQRWQNKPWLKAPRLPSALGLNAAISGATVLASRLDSTTSVYSFMLFSIVWFGLLPPARSYFRGQRPHEAVLTALLSIFTILTLLTLSLTVAIIFVIFALGITFGIPAGILWAQKYKNQIHGPWDQVVPRM